MKLIQLLKCLLVLCGSLIFCNNSWADSAMVVAAAQLDTADAGNFNKIRALVHQAKLGGAKLIIFPEDSVFGWLNPEVFLKAEPIPGKYSDQFAAIAKEEHMWIATGIGEQGPKAGSGSQAGAHQAYDSGILINPDGQIILHHRQFNVLKNSFNPEACKQILNEDQCGYIPGDLSDIKPIDTPFGKTAILVCADAYTYPPAQALDTLKQQNPDFVIVPWGITASTQSECGTSGFNATGYASEAAVYLKSAFVVGANALGPRNYGRFLPSLYCGTSGYAIPTGESTETPTPSSELVFFKINPNFDAEAGPIWSDQDAQSKCPTTCSNYSAKWTGAWHTTIPGKMSVCECTKSNSMEKVPEQTSFVGTITHLDLIYTCSASIDLKLTAGPASVVTLNGISQPQCENIYSCNIKYTKSWQTGNPARPDVLPLKIDNRSYNINLYCKEPQ